MERSSALARRLVTHPQDSPPQRTSIGVQCLVSDAGCAAPAAAAVGTPTRLDLCPTCGEGFVYPVQWTESGSADWWLLLRCGACGEWRDVVASNYAVAAFDRLLDEEMDVIKAAAEKLERESLAAAADTSAPRCAWICWALTTSGERASRRCRHGQLLGGGRLPVPSRAAGRPYTPGSGLLSTPRAAITNRSRCSVRRVRRPWRTAVIRRRERFDRSRHRGRPRIEASRWPSQPAVRSGRRRCERGPTPSSRSRRRRPARGRSEPPGRSVLQQRSRAGPDPLRGPRRRSSRAHPPHAQRPWCGCPRRADGSRDFPASNSMGDQRRICPGWVRTSSTCSGVAFASAREVQPSMCDARIGGRPVVSDHAHFWAPTSPSRWAVRFDAQLSKPGPLAQPRRRLAS